MPLVVAIGSLLALCSISQPALGATAGAPTSLPGPPPGADAGFPPAPVIGSTPPAESVGPATSIPTHVPGPGLMGGTATLHARVLPLEIACRTGGSASLSSPAIGKGVIAHAGYTCSGHRGFTQLKLSAHNANQLRRLGSALGRVTVGRGGASEQFSVMLAAHGVASGFWSDGGLECSLLGPNEPYLVAPNFTTTSTELIDVRPWIAFYTSANGWQWLGTEGLNRSSWYEWTGTPSGVAQWRTPAGALNPWTWAPIFVAGGRGTYAIGAFEVIYWDTATKYVWRYARSETSVGGSNFCAYP